MRVILKNLFTALRRYPAAVALNVAGLAVAFAAFLVILIEVRFEYGFDTCHPGSERIFRVEMRSPELADSWFTMLNYPLISDLAGSSAHIEAASALEMLGPGLELEVPEPNGERRLFRETVKRCNSSFVRVLGLRLTEGDAAGLNTSAGLLLPRSCLPIRSSRTGSAGAAPIPISSPSGRPTTTCVSSASIRRPRATRSPRR